MGKFLSPRVKGVLCSPWGGVRGRGVNVLQSETQIVPRDAESFFLTYVASFSNEQFRIDLLLKADTLAALGLLQGLQLLQLLLDGLLGRGNRLLVGRAGLVALGLELVLLELDRLLVDRDDLPQLGARGA